MPRSIFVTGGGGFIGQTLVPRLAASGDCSVKILTRRLLAEFVSGERRPTQVIGDLLSPSTYQEELEGSDVVVHLAAVTGRAAPAEYRRVNVEGTRALLQACKEAGVRQFVYMSTIAAVYADQRYYPYAKTKAQAEALVLESGLEFSIIRPTLVLGAKSPIWNTLIKISELPIIPMPEGRRPVLVQPIHANDVVRGVEILLESGRFEGTALDLGGPSPLPFIEFLALIQSALRGEPGRIVRVPLGPIRALLSFMEPALRPLMPVTAGQLAVFANDSVPSDNWLLARLRADMPSAEETVSALLDPVGGNSGGAIDRPRSRPPARPMSGDARQTLEDECRSFTAYLVGTFPNAYVIDQYARAAHAHGLASDEDCSCFDRATLKLARSGPIFVRWADAYCAILRRRGVLRGKLIVLAAILEHVAPANEAFDRIAPRSVARTILSLAGHGSAFALSLLLGAAILIPASVLCWFTTRTMQSSVPMGSAK